MRKRNTVSKIGKAVVTFSDDGAGKDLRGTNDRCVAHSATSSDDDDGGDSTGSDGNEPTSERRSCRRPASNARRLTSSKPNATHAGDGTSARGPPDPLLTVREAANILRCSVSLLNKWRLIGRGPRFVYVGSRVRYRAADLSAFISELTRTSTSQQRPAA